MLTFISILCAFGSGFFLRQWLLLRNDEGYGEGYADGFEAGKAVGRARGANGRFAGK